MSKHTVHITYADIMLISLLLHMRNPENVLTIAKTGPAKTGPAGPLATAMEGTTM